MRRQAVAIAVGILATAGCGSSSSSTAVGTAVTITSPSDRSAVGGNVLVLDLEAVGVQIVKPNGDTSGQTGHYHVFVDKQPVPVGTVIPRGPGIVHSERSPITIPGLTLGFHTFRVVLGDGVHRRLPGTPAEITVDVTGPSITATAPATVPSGEPVPVSLSAQGVAIVKPDGDTSGGTGHYHLFVDRPIVRPGATIPKEPGIIHSTESTVLVPDLPPGRHVIWVVLGDGAHRAASPLVAAQVSVTVT